MSAKPLNIDAYRLMHEGILAFAKIERHGLRLDVDYCESTAFHLSRQIARMEMQFEESELVSMWKRVYGRSFKLTSPDQLVNILFNPEHMGLQPTKYAEGQCKKCRGRGCSLCWGSGRNPSVDEEALEATKLEDLQILLKIRKFKKIKDTYILGFLKEQVNGVVHPFLNLNTTRTFRPSTDSPNLANVPKRDPEAQKLCRRAFIPSPGNQILSADFKGVEVSIAACYNKDPKLIEYVTDKTTDMHRDMAMQLFILSQNQIVKAIRHSGKNQFVFPEFYGDYFGNCAQALWLSAHNDTHTLPCGTQLMDWLKKKGLGSYQLFEDHVKKVEDHFWNTRFKVYSEWKEQWRQDYYKNGYFDSLTGFRYQGVMDRNCVINYPIQGSAFHVMLQSIIWLMELVEKYKWKSRICNQIYDDLMWDLYPPEKDEIIDAMQDIMTKRIRKHWPWIIVPLEIDVSIAGVDRSWYELEEIKH